MKRTHLRILLLCAVLLAALSTWTNNTMTSVIPLSVVEEMDKSMPDSTLRVLSMSAVFLAHIGLGAIGLVGMFLFWSPSRHIYMFSAVSRAVLPAFFVWTPHSGIDLTVRSCWLLLDGLVLSLAFWGPAAPLFNAARGRTSNGMGTLLSEGPPHTTNRTDRVISGSAAIDRMTSAE